MDAFIYSQLHELRINKSIYNFILRDSANRGILVSAMVMARASIILSALSHRRRG